MKSVALGGFSKAYIHYYEGELHLRVYHSRLPIQDAPGPRPYCPSCRYLAPLNPPLALLERSCWELIAAGALIAPLLYEATKAEHFKPLTSPYWKLASICYSMLREVYAGRANYYAIVACARRIIRAVAEKLDSIIGALRVLLDLECAREHTGYIVMDDLLGLYSSPRRRLLDAHTLIVRTGYTLASVHPTGYKPPRGNNAECALLLESKPVEAGPYARVQVYMRRDLSAAACGLSLQLDENTLRVEHHGMWGKRVELDLEALHEGIMPPRISALLIDSIVSAIHSCVFLEKSVQSLYASDTALEAVHGPLIYWRSGNSWIATLPSLYNTYSSELGRSPFYQHVSSLCEDRDPRRISALIMALYYYNTHCGEAEVNVVTRKGFMARKATIPRVKVVWSK